MLLNLQLKIEIYPISANLIFKEQIHNKKPCSIIKAGFRLVKMLLNYHLFQGANMLNQVYQFI